MVSRLVFDWALHNCVVVIYFILSMFMLIKAVKVLKNGENDQIATSFKIYFLSVLILCTLWVTSVFLNQFTFTIFNALSIKMRNPLLFCKIQHRYQMVLLTVYETSVLYYFATRIQKLFSTPKLKRFQLPNWLIPGYKILALLVAIVTIICGTIAVTPLIFDPFTANIDINNPPSNWTYCLSIGDEESHIDFITVLFVYAVILYILNICIWFIFINRFYVLVKDQMNRRMNSTQKVDGNTMIKASENEDALMLIHVMKKQTLLVGIATTSTIVLWLIMFNAAPAITAWLLDFGITEICVFLSWGSFEKYYKMIGCEFWEKRCCKCVDDILDAKLNAKTINI